MSNNKLLRKRAASEMSPSLPSINETTAEEMVCAPTPPKRARLCERPSRASHSLSGPPLDAALILPMELWTLVLQNHTPNWMLRICCMVCTAWRSCLWPGIVEKEETGRPIPNHGIVFRRLVKGQHWDLLHWCNINGMVKDDQACMQAARQGSVYRFRQLVHCGFPHNADTTAELAGLGDLPMLQKVRIVV